MIKYKISTIYRHKVQLVCILCLFPVFLGAQSIKNKALPERTTTITARAAKSTVKSPRLVPKKASKEPAPLIAPPKMLQVKTKKNSSKSKIYLDHFERLSFNALNSPDYQVLIGDVRFHHEGAYLYCDSAYYYMKTNSLAAFGNVHMEQGDTLFLYGARLFYDGNAKLVTVREKVRLENRKVTLFTDSLNYDRISNIGYFFDGGLLVNEDKNVTNELSSEYGQYSSVTKMADFKNDVKLVHPKFVLTNQELNYNTASSVANISCPTEIVADSGYIYTEKGWYNSRNDQSMLLNRSYVLSGHRRLTGDTINYDSKKGIGEAFGKVVLIDSTQQITLKGDYGYSEEKTEYALMSKNALMIEHSSKDTLYMHADSLVTKKDSIYKAVTAYRGVRIFRSDIQGVCDSLSYSTRDSILNFYYKPVLWSQQQQLSGEFIQLITKNKKADYLHIQKSAMVISQEADSLYNQLSGKDLIAYFDSGQVVRVEIKGNAETVFLPHDDKTKEIIGLNRLEGSSLTLFMENKKLKKLIVWPKPVGKFYPLEKLNADARYLKNFAWYNSVRPTGPDDVFRKMIVPVANKEGVASGRRTGSASEIPVEVKGKAPVKKSPAGKKRSSRK